MKKFIAMMLCLLMVVPMLASCKTDLENEDKGPTIPVYITSEIANFDPAYGNLDDAAMKILGLMYEGLFAIDEDGDVVRQQAKKVKILDDESKNYYAIEITLDDTSWSDGTQVQAADYVFAWKRILESEFRGDAAAMLMDIKNARKVASGDASIDDLGVTDEEIDVLRIEFEGPVDYEKFYEYLASPLLVPLRETAVDKVDANWASCSSILVSNGPFAVKSYTAGERLLLERNAYYYRNENKDSIRASVKPYRFEIFFGKTATEVLTQLENREIVFDGELPLDVRASYLESGKVEVADTMYMMACVFNVRKAPFDNADVRKALSLVLDRNEIVKILTFAKPAEGMITDGVFNTGYGSKAQSFRDAAGEALIAPTANETEARKLLSDSGVKAGTVTLTIRDNESDKAVADYIKSAWGKLGFTVKVDIKKFEAERNDKEYDVVIDHYLDAYDSGNFEVILMDYQMLTTDAFPNLAMFAQAFSGGRMNMDTSDADYGIMTHASGYANEAYDAKIEEAFAVKDDREARAALLHEAERMLLDDMPVIPLVELQSGVIISEDLTKVTDSYWGIYHFTKSVLKDRYHYDETLPPDTEEDE